MPVLRIKKNGVWEDIMGGSVEVPEINYPVTSVNGMTGDVVIDIPEGFSGSWNDLTDKPFGEESVSSRNTVYEETIDNTSINATYRILDYSIDQLENRNVVVTVNGVEYESVCTFDSGSYSIALGDGVHYISQHVTDDGASITKLEAAIYEIKIETVETSEVTVPLDEKFVPDTIARVSDIPTIPDSLPANGGNADTLDGKHASDFATATDVETLQGLVGEDSVSTQIENAVKDISAGKTLTEHFAEENMVLTALQYGTELPSAGIVGRIFFKKV